MSSDFGFLVGGGVDFCSSLERGEKMPESVSVPSVSVMWNSSSDVSRDEMIDDWQLELPERLNNAWNKWGQARSLFRLKIWTKIEIFKLDQANPCLFSGQLVVHFSFG